MVATIDDTAKPEGSSISCSAPLPKNTALKPKVAILIVEPTINLKISILSEPRQSKHRRI